jgi:CRP/FNR family cyclic AMP-dependent transcriptional regulator
MLTDELGSLALFEECTRKELRRIARLATSVEVPSGRVLCVEGAVGSEFFVIVRGCAHVDRASRTIATLVPGQTFGELALLCRTSVPYRTATVRAAEPMTVLVFTRAEFNSLIDTVPSVARRLLERVGTLALGFAAEKEAVSESGAGRSTLGRNADGHGTIASVG